MVVRTNGLLQRRCLNGFGIGTRGSQKFWGWSTLAGGAGWMLHYNVSETDGGGRNGIE